MKKIAYPLTEDFDQMGHIFDPQGDAFMDPQVETQVGSDAFVPHKFTGPDENQTPVTIIEEGMTSHMDVEDNSYNLADDENEDKEALVEIWDEDGDPVASFACDVAKTYQQQVIGLQSYDKLPKNAGLVFPYSSPKNVMYHMGTVSFPIDIIFVGEDETIKKIYSNIQPGTLGTFGCADVKHVLEICGGLSERLGIQEGQNASLQGSSNRFTDLKKACGSMGVEKDIIVSYSNYIRSGISNWKNYPVLTLNNSQDMEKTASSLKQSIAYDLAKEFRPEEQKSISLFYFDSIIDSNILVHKLAEFDEDKRLSKTLDNRVVVAAGSRLVQLDKFAKNKGEGVLNSIAVLYKFLPYNEESDDMMTFFKEEYAGDNRLVVATSFKNKSLFKKLLLSRASLEAGYELSPSAVQVIHVNEEPDAINLIEEVRKFSEDELVLFAPDSLAKAAGVPVPDDIKNMARRAYKQLEKAEDTAMKSLEGMKKNLNEYEKIKDKSDDIPKTKGQYNQSVKRNTKIVRDYLLRIRDGIKVLNEIKDVSTTMEIIDSLANSAKEASSSAEDIFDLIELIETTDFPILLGEKTGVYEKTINDLVSTIERAKDYINNNILGLVVLSN